MDVKPEEFARRDEVAQVFAWTGRVCGVRGWSYEVWTGVDPGITQSFIGVRGDRAPLPSRRCRIRRDLLSP